jgi:uncharacterized protein YjbI with pentapeptide repeats
MADTPVDILRQGSSAWSDWRAAHPNFSPLLRSADLRGLHLSGVDLGGSDLREAKLRGADLRKSNLRDVQLSHADLSEADLSGATLAWANATHVCLADANISNADCRGADLRNVDLRRATLVQVDFRGASVMYADLSGANLRAANLNGTNLTGSSLVEADFDSAVLLETILADVTFCAAKNLDKCIHIGPSVVDSRTLAKCPDLPTTFLRGCGVPDELIRLTLSLRDAAVFATCFISYSTKDQEFADCLYADLQNKGVRCWFSPHDVKGGRKLHDQIDEAIRVYDRLLLILSEASMNSEWVKTEIDNARQREFREKRQMLFPIRLVPFERVKAWKAFDADTGKDSAREVREYFIPDFSNWKDHNSYQKAFERLLKDLKTEAKTGASE